MQIVAAFSKKNLEESNIVKAITEIFDTHKGDILIIEDGNGWLKRDKQNFVIQYNGVIDDPEEDEYIGMHYYDINFEDESCLNSMNKLAEVLDVMIE